MLSKRTSFSYFDGLVWVSGPTLVGIDGQKWAPELMRKVLLYLDETTEWALYQRDLGYTMRAKTHRDAEYPDVFQEDLHLIPGTCGTLTEVGALLATYVCMSIGGSNDKT